MRTVARDNNPTVDTEVSSIPSTEPGLLSKKTLKRIAVVAGIALGAYLLGFIPMWLNANDLERDLEVTKAQLKPLTLRDDLANAAISAQRGEYEIARQRASEFFTSLREEADRDSGAVLGVNQRETVENILDQRDETITLIARNDPAAADKLSDLYYHFLHVGKESDRKVAP